jgi:hypothetical protein
LTSEAKDVLKQLANSDSKKHKKVLKTLGLIETNLRHPGLKTPATAPHQEFAAVPSASALERRTPGAKRSPRGRPAQIATPTDIRWPVVQEYLRSSSLSPNSQKLYERELKRFLGWTQCRWSKLQSRHLGLYKAYLRELGN